MKRSRVTYDFTVSIEACQEQAEHRCPRQKQELASCFVTHIGPFPAGWTDQSVISDLFCNCSLCVLPSKGGPTRADRSLEHLKRLKLTRPPGSTCSRSFPLVCGATTLFINLHLLHRGLASGRCPATVISSVVVTAAAAIWSAAAQLLPSSRFFFLSVSSHNRCKVDHPLG